MRRVIACRCSCRVDIRGSGDSDGVLLDEYTEVELRDGCDAIAFVAGMVWCTGKVGVIGKSWGGFNGLQLAALNPPALGAVVSVCSTDDRYADGVGIACVAPHDAQRTFHVTRACCAPDIHTMGGCQLAEHHQWASVMLAYNARPCDPSLRPDDWREVWAERVQTAGFWLSKWLQQPHRSAFWCVRAV